MKPTTQLKTPSIGAVIKKAILLYPEISAPALIAIIQKSIVKHRTTSGEFSGVDTVDEEKVLKLVRAASPHVN